MKGASQCRKEMQALTERHEGAKVVWTKDRKALEDLVKQGWMNQTVLQKQIDQNKEQIHILNLSLNDSLQENVSSSSCFVWFLLVSGCGVIMTQIWFTLKKTNKHAFKFHFWTFYETQTWNWLFYIMSPEQEVVNRSGWVKSEQLCKYLPNQIIWRLNAALVQWGGRISVRALPGKTFLIMFTLSLGLWCSCQNIFLLFKGVILY